MTTLWWCQQSRSHWKQWNHFRIGLQPILEQLTKIFVITVKELEPATSWVRDQHATSVPARHMWETGSLNCAQFMLQWLIRFPEFAEFGEFLFHLGKTPLFQSDQYRQRHRSIVAALTLMLSVNEPLRLYFFWSPEAIQKPENSTQSWRFQFTFDETRYFTTCWSWSQEFYSEWWRSLRSWCHHQRRIDIVMVCKQRGYFT